MVTSEDAPKLIIEDHYAYMFGYPNLTFRSDNNMTRAEATAMFARIMEQKPIIGKQYPSDFKDVKDGDWYYDAIGFMKDMGVISGYPDGTFKPDAPITRGEFAMMASKFAKLSPFSSNSFSDLQENHWAFGVINSAVSKGWVNGYPDGTFKADREITRAEVVTIVNRMLNRKADEGFVLENQHLLVQFKDINKSQWAYLNIMEATHGHDYSRKTNGIDEIWHRLNGKDFPFAVVGYFEK
ncbi:MAG: S-layer homology domain-containing protein [Tissierellia bacterium]|nr:S-layer homology domain-containing protein [Tissierellia bacterium]